MRLDEAVESYDRALRIHPELAEAHSTRGNALKDFMRLHEAVLWPEGNLFNFASELQDFSDTRSSRTST